jgi:phosphotriesterase-related protein
MAPIVRTVRGDVAPAALGATDAHDHLFFATPAEPGGEFLDVARAIEEARMAVAAGVEALIEWTPIGLGRNPAGLLKVSETTGLIVVASTGLHCDVHYLPDDALRAAGVDELAKRFAADIGDAPAPAGMIKIGASYHHLTPFEQTVFDAAALAHERTGAPIGVHTEHGTMGLEIVGRLAARGVPATSIILAHLDRNPDAGEHAETAATGAFLELDGPGRAKYWPDSTILTLIAELVDRGHADRILLGGDTGRASMLRSYGGGPGLDYLFARFKPRLERELGAELAHTIFVRNPARAFAFEPNLSKGAPTP